MKLAELTRTRFKTLPWLALGSCLFATASASTVSLYTSETEEPEPKKNEIVVTIGDPNFSDGSNALQIAETLGIEDDQLLGGIEKFYWENSDDADWRIFMNGRFLIRPDEISLSIEAVKPEEKLLKIEFQRWKDYDYGAGIYYRPTGNFPVNSSEALEERISKVRVTFQMQPSYELKWKIEYSALVREGSGLSTSFGDDFHYLINRTVSRGIVPSLVEGKESVHNIDVSVVNSEEVTRKGLRFHFQRRQVEQQRVTERATEQPKANRTTTHKDESKDDLFSMSAFTRKALTDSISGSVGVAVTRLDGDITGSRVFGANPEATYDIDFVNTQLDDRGFLDLEGTRQLRQFLLNANFVYEPEGNWRWMGGVRFERLSTELFNSYLDTVDQVNWAMSERQDQEALMTSVSDKSAEDYSLFLEGRYKKFSKAQFYSRIESAIQKGDLDEGWNRELVVPVAEIGTSLLDRVTDFDRTRHFWETGVNYHPFNSLRISLEGYLKQKENEYDYSRLDVPDADYTLYPSYIEEQEFFIEDVNARVHWRILPGLRSVTRVDVQNTTIESKDRVNPEIENAERERVVFNQAVTWTPHPRVFVNASYNLVDDLTKNVASTLEGHFQGIVVDLPNDYWQADLNLFVVLTKSIDMQLGYHVLEAKNFVDNTPRTVAYGSDIEQTHGSLAFHIKFSENMAAKIGYHYYEQTDMAAAGLRDFEVQVVNSSLQYRF